MNPLEVKKELEQQGFALERLDIEGSTVILYDRDGKPFRIPSTASPKYVTDCLKRGFVLTPPQTPGVRLGFSPEGAPKKQKDSESLSIKKEKEMEVVASVKQEAEPPLPSKPSKLKRKFKFFKRR